MRYVLALILFATPALAADPHFFKDKYGRDVFTAEGQNYFVVCGDRTICIKAYAESDEAALRVIEANAPPVGPNSPIPRGGR
jgi:hypothetical protein